MASANTVQVVINAVDQASSKVAAVSSAFTGLGADVGAVSQKISDGLGKSFQDFSGDARQQLESVSDGLERIGLTAVSTAVSIGALGVSLFKEFQGFIKLLDDIDRSLERTLGSNLGELVGQATQQIVDEVSDASQVALTDVLGTLGQSATVAIGFEPSVRNATSAAGQIQSVFLKAAGGIANAFDKAFLGLSDKLQKRVSSTLSIGDTLSSFSFKFSGGGEALEIFGALRNGVGQAVDAISQGAQEVFYFTQAIDILKGVVVGGPYELLIGQNVRLQEQLLATQSSLAATNQILVSGQKVADPTQAIQALTGPVNDAIDQIRQGSLDLVNVTSKDLIESFQIIAGEAGNIGFSLSQASELSLSFGATLGTLGVPLAQSRQEILSILQGTIDMNSVVAKSLGITNAQAQNWKQQGTLVDNLLKKMEAFRAGNKLASQTLGGVTSNIQELIDTIALQAGAPILQPLVAQISKFYDYLKSNQNQIAAYVSDVVGRLFGAFQGIIEGLGAIFQASQGTLVNTLSLLFDALIDAANAFGNALKTASVILAPFLGILGQLSAITGPLISPLFQIGIQIKILTLAVSASTGAFKSFTNTIPLVGELMLLMELRTNSLVGLFTGLSKGAGLALGGFLTLGANLQKIPGAFDLVASKIPILGPQIAALIPTLSAGGIALLNFGKQFPGAVQFIDDFSQKIAASAGASGQGIATIGKGLSTLLSGNVDGLKGIASGIAEIAENNKLLAPLAPTLKNFADNADIAAFANQKLAEAAAQVRAQLVKSLINFGAIGLIIGAAALAINESNRKFLIAVGEAIKSFGEKVYQFLSSPLGIVLLAVTGLTIAIRTGLVASTLEAAKAFASLVQGNVPQWIQSVYSGIEQTSKAIVDFPATLTNLFDPDAKAQAEQMASILAEDAENFKNAVEQKKQAIADLEQETTRRQEAGTKGIAVGGLGIESLTEEKQKLQAELDDLLGGREQQLAGLKQKLQADFARQPAIAPPISERFTQTLDKAKGSLTQFQGVAQRLGGDTLIRLGQGLANTGFAELGTQAAMAGNKLFEAGAQTLTSEQALAGIGNTSKLAQVNLAGAGNAIGRAGSAIATGFRAAAGAVTGFLAATGPLILVTGALFLATEAVASFSKLNDAGSASTKKFTEAIQEQINKLDELERKRKGQTGQPTDDNQQKDTQQLQGDRLKKIKEEQNFFGKAVDALAGYETSQSSTANKLYDQLADREQELRALQDQRKNAVVTGNQQEIAKIDEKIKSKEQEIAASKSAIDQQRQSGSGVTLGLSGKQLEEESKAFDNTLRTARDTYAEFANERYKQQVELESGLTELQKQRAEAARNGNTSEVNSIDERIKATEESIEQGKTAVKTAIDRLAEQQPLNKKQAQDQQAEIQRLAELQNKYKGLKTTIIESVTAPELGSATEQLQNNLNKVDFGALSEGKAKGTTEKIETDVKAAISAIQELQKTGAISAEEAAIKYGQVASSSQISAELQLQAQQLLTQATQAESQKRSEALDSEIAGIETKALKGQIGQEEAEKQVTAKKKEQIQERLRAVEESIAEENRLRAEQLQGTLADLDRQIGEAQTNAGKTTKPEERQKADDTVKDLQAKRQQAQESYESAVKEGDRKLNNERVKAAGETARLEAEQRDKELERAQKKALDAVKKAETERAIETQKLVNSGAITEAEANERRVNSNQERIQGELKAEDAKLKELQKNPKKNEEQIRDSRQKILELTKQSLESEQAQYDAHLKTLQDKLKTQQNKALLAIQQRVNSGQATEQQAEEEKARLTVDRLEKEVQLETKNKDKKLELELQLAQARKDLQDKQLAARIKDIQNQSLAVQNSFRREVQELEKELQLMTALEKALEGRNALLQAAKDLNAAGASFLTGELDAIAKTEKSELRKRELAQITAKIKLEALAREQEIAAQIFEIEQKRNKLAIARKDLENRRDLAKAEGEAKKSDADFKVGQEEFRAGKITKEELESRRIDRDQKRDELGFRKQERSLIQEEKALQPQMEAAQRQKFQLDQRSARTSAQAAAFETLSPGEQAKVRKEFQKNILGDVFGGQFQSREELVKGTLGKAKTGIQNELTGQRSDTRLLDSGVGVPQRSVATLSAAQAPTVKLDLSNLRELQKVPQLAAFTASPAQQPQTQSSIPSQGVSAQPINMTNTFSITVNANSKDVGQKTGEEVVSYVDKLLKQAKALAK